MAAALGALEPTTKAATRPRTRSPARSRRRPAGTRTGAVPFSSARKWSAASFGDHGTWVLGAPEMVWLDARRSRCGTRPTSSRPTGNRVLLLARGRRARRRGAAGRTSQPVALVLLEEKVRPDAAETLAYFHAAGRRAQGDLRRQPADGRRGRPAGRPARRRRPGRRPRAARGHRRARRGARARTRCSAGSRRTRSGRWSRRCSRAATSSR